MTTVIPSDPVIFTDMDGTLIDRDTYSADAVAPLVRRLVALGVPVIFCSSKTFAEQMEYRRILALPDPFIVENGGAVFLPEDYFPFDIGKGTEKKGFRVLESGTGAGKIDEILLHVRSEAGISFRTYRDLDPEEMVRITGLSPESAIRAARRDYSQTIVPPLSAENLVRLRCALKPHGLVAVEGSRFVTVASGDCSKGTAVSLLTDLYRRQFPAVVTCGIGDSANDREMLDVVDRPFLVQGPDRSWHPAMGSRVERIPAPGPLGWCMAVLMLMAECGVDLR